MSDTGWFADMATPDENPPAPTPWRPYLQFDGIAIPMEAWFADEESCEQFIREVIIGKGILHGNGN